MARSLQGCNLRSMYTLPFDPLIFRIIPGHRQYVINNDGTVIKRIASDNIIRKSHLTIWYQVINRKRTGYLYASIATKNAIDINGEVYDSGSSPVSVHRLVALAWVHNADPINFLWVNHENGIKEDCRHTNLIWGTISYNIQHAIDTGLRKTYTGKDHWNYGKHIPDSAKQLMAAAKLGELHPKFKGYYITPAGRYTSLRQAAIGTGKDRRAIQRSILYREHGFTFEPVQKPCMSLSLQPG